MALDLWFDVANNRLQRWSSDLDINWQYSEHSNYTALHIAVVNNHLQMVQLLLKHPKIDLNGKDAYGNTPFTYSCWVPDRFDTLKLLLTDSRLDINTRDKYGYSPIWWICCNGLYLAIEWIIALRPDDIDDNKIGTDDTQQMNILEVARACNRVRTVDLLERFFNDRTRIVYNIRRELKIPKYLAVDLFVLVILFSDDFLEFKVPEDPKVKRLFLILKRLPIEIQMVCCHRIFGSSRNIIQSKDFEDGLRDYYRSQKICQI